MPVTWGPFKSAGFSNKPKFTWRNGNLLQHIDPQVFFSGEVEVNNDGQGPKKQSWEFCLVVFFCKNCEFSAVFCCRKIVWTLGPGGRKEMQMHLSPDERQCRMNGWYFRFFVGGSYERGIKQTAKTAFQTYRTTRREVRFDIKKYASPLERFHCWRSWRIFQSCVFQYPLNCLLVGEAFVCVYI